MNPKDIIKSICSGIVMTIGIILTVIGLFVVLLYTGLIDSFAFFVFVILFAIVFYSQIYYRGLK